MKNILQRSRLLFENNKKVIENYFFMTVLQVLNSLFYLMIYPFLIRTLGMESYGLYVFAMSIVTYFIYFVNYGFDFVAVKIIAQSPENQEVKTETLSSVFSAKVYLEMLSFIIFTVVVFAIPVLRSNLNIFFICFIQTISGILFPQWYFQGIQKMRTVTFIQLFFKVASLPFIFTLINSSTDLWVFVLITSLVSLLGAITATVIVRYTENVKINLLSFRKVMTWYKDAFPFFLSISTGIIKEQSITIIIGVFFGMKDVAIYDLANKIILVPRTLLMSVNGALFPKIVSNVNLTVIKKIINYEFVVGMLVVLGVAVFGEWIVLFIGGNAMQQAYPLSIILSITVMVWMVVGAYISFIFIPQGKNYYVSKNQLVAFLSFFIYCCIGLLIIRSIYVLVISIALSGLTEIVYCNYVIKKDKLM